jgi:7-cyano-7-deazaguanine synthase in queuosine biosynthesis
MILHEKGFNPIEIKSDINIIEWIKDTNNLVFLIDTDPIPICMKRCYFDSDISSIPNNNIVLSCDIKPELIKNFGKDKKSYLDINKYNITRDSIITELKKFISLVTDKEKQIFIINKENEIFKGINQETNIVIENYKKAFFDYSFQWDGPINYFLRNGDSYFDTEIFKDKYKIYGDTLEIAKDNIINKIRYIDKCFLQYAKINDSNELYLYRGMKDHYPFEKIGDSILLKNFTSVSNKMGVSMRFMKSSTIIGIKYACCLYKIHVPKGIPYIDMRESTKFKRESEILLPRDLILYYIGDTKEKGIKIRHVSISKRTEDQFELVEKINCKDYFKSKMTAINQSKLKKMIGVVTPVIKVTKPKSDNKKTEKIREPKEKTARCPKGTRKNKKTGNCEKKEAVLV